MKRFVLDASVVLTWRFPDEEAQKAAEIAERIAMGHRVAVPAFWRHEILNPAPAIMFDDAIPLPQAWPYSLRCGLS